MSTDRERGMDLIRLSTIIVCMLLVLPACRSVQSARREPAVEPHVGFKLLWTKDYARRFANDVYVRDARPIPVFIWYPVGDDVPDKVPRLTLRDYVEGQMYPQSPESGDFAAAARGYILESMHAYAVDPLTSDEAVGEQLQERLLASPSRAVPEAAHSSGSFPVVIYHPGLGGNPLENLALCESLAAAGFVVTSSTFFHQHSWQDSFYCGEIATSLEDIRFLLNIIQGEVRSADLGRVAIVGHSFGAQVALIAACQPENIIDAVVAIDSTLDSKSIDEIESALYRSTSWHDVLETVTHSFSNCRAAVLSISGTSPGGSTPAYSVIKRLIESRLWLATVNYSIAHESFLSQSITAAQEHVPVSPQGVALRERDERTYHAMSALIVGFLSSELLGMDEPFHDVGPNISLAECDTLHSPSGAELLALYKRDGIGAVESLYRSLHAVSPRVRFNPNPILDDMHTRHAHADVIAFVRFLLSFDVNRTNWRLHRRLANTHEAIGEREHAWTHYRRALDHCDDFEVAREMQDRLDVLSPMSRSR